MERLYYRTLNLDKVRAQVLHYRRELHPLMLKASGGDVSERDALIAAYQCLQRLHASMAKDMVELEIMLAKLPLSSAAEKQARNSWQCSDTLLTCKENEVLNMFAKGYSYCEVAGLLDCKLATIQTHAKRIYKKLKVHSRSEAIFEARQLGLVQA